ncbi:MAG: sulfotransferase domain-containing protein [Acidobacteriota bacterium]
MKNAGVFYLSTGRCGTQWLKTALAATYPETAVVSHEPVRGAYQPKLYLRAYDKLPELLSCPEISTHLSYIRQTLQSKTYIETGWPCYPAIPLMIEQLEGRVRLVHLIRHPVHVALSLATHGVYERQDWIASSAISPFDPGVVQKDLADGWVSMGMYEKCLFWWTEVNLYALELIGLYPDIECCSVRYEDLFDQDTRTLERLSRFMNLEYAPSIEQLRVKNIDRYHRTSLPVDWELVFKYPRTVALARQCGYDFDGLSTPHLAARYFLQ